jgi:hypothetical protein
VKIAVTDLTRMQPGCKCVAGVDVDSGAHVRSIVVGGRLGSELLTCHGGPFDLTTTVDLRITAPVPRPPQVEDHAFKPRNARSIGPIEPSIFWDMLDHLSEPKLATLFGPDLKYLRSGRAGVVQDHGSASLGCLKPVRPPCLSIRRRERGYDQVRVTADDGVFRLDLSATDIRLFGDDHITPDPAAIERVRAQIARGVRVLLSVGLTRPFAPSPDAPPIHWLQVNNIHLQSDPCWRLQ